MVIRETCVTTAHCLFFVNLTSGFEFSQIYSPVSSDSSLEIHPRNNAAFQIIREEVA